MPAVIPVIAGLATAAAGASAITIAAGFTFANIAAGAMVVGGAMTAIGGATGNKKLMKAGAVVSLAGGIGSWAAGTFGAASTSAAAEGTNVAAFGANANASAAGAAIDAGTAAGTAGAAGTTGGAMSSATPKVFDTLAADAGTTAAAGTQPGVVSTAGDLASQTTSAASSDALADKVISETMMRTTTEAPSFLDKLEGGLDTLNKYDKLVNMAAGAADSYSEDQRNEAQLKAYTARADKDRALTLEQWQTQQANANAQFNVPLNYVPNQGGLINTARRQQPIRGVV